MLVNREGFLREAGYDALTTIVRTGIALSTRLRASCTCALTRATPKADPRDFDRETDKSPATIAVELRHNVKTSVDRVKELASDAERLAKEGNLSATRKRMAEVVAAVNEVQEGVSGASEMLMSETAMLRILASPTLMPPGLLNSLKNWFALLSSCSISLQTSSPSAFRSVINSSISLTVSWRSFSFSFREFKTSSKCSLLGVKSYFFGSTD